MQAYQSADQPYYPSSQAQFTQPHTTYFTQYAPYPQYVLQPSTAVPFPYGTASYEPHRQAQYATPAPSRRRKLSRSKASAPAQMESVANQPVSTRTPRTQSRPLAPLKSAMKKSQSQQPEPEAVEPPSRTPSNGSGLSRRRSSLERMRVNSLTRPRADSQSKPAPQHLFVSFHSSNELRVENIAYQSTLDALRESVLPMWPESVAMDNGFDEKWHVRFAGRPWTSVGIDAMIAQRLVCRIWAILAAEGYSYLTTVDTGSSSRTPRFVFVHSPQDETAPFFMITFSRSSDKISLLDVPSELASHLTQYLRGIYPRRISAYRATEDGIHVVEVKKGSYGTRVDRSLFMAYILQFFSSMGFKLDGSVPLGRRAAFGFGPRKEVWIFRGLPRRSESRQSRQKQ